VWPTLRTGGLMLLYVIGYTAGRLVIELVRIDEANEILGQRVNVWVSVVVLVAAAGWLVMFQLGRWPRAGSVQPGDPGDTALPGRETSTSH
jgi:prolipoprotein diacylglyceryltransferase